MKILLCICNFLSNVVYSIIAPLIPIKFKEKGITGGIVGVVFMSFSMGSYIFE